MARPTWTLTGPLSAPHGAVLAGTEITLSLVPGVSRDPSGSDLRAGSTVAVVGTDGTLTVKGTGDPVMLLASSPDAPVHYRLSCIPRVLPTVTFTAPEGGSLALDDIVPEVPAPIPAVDASTLRAEWQAALDGKQPAGSYAAGVHTHTAAQIADATTAGRALVTAADAAAQRTALGLAAVVKTVNGTGPDGAGNVAIPAATDATVSAKGVVQLAGDLGGTAAAPTVPGLAGKAALAHTHAAADVDSGASSDGQVLTSDGAGGAAWEPLPPGVQGVGVSTVWAGSQAAYDAISTPDPNTLYFVTG